MCNSCAIRVPLVARSELKALLSVFLSLYVHPFSGQKWQLKGIISTADKRKQEGNGGKERQDQICSQNRRNVNDIVMLTTILLDALTLETTSI